MYITENKHVIIEHSNEALITMEDGIKMCIL